MVSRAQRIFIPIHLFAQGFLQLLLATALTSLTPILHPSLAPCLTQLDALVIDLHVHHQGGAIPQDHGP